MTRFPFFGVLPLPLLLALVVGCTSEGTVSVRFADGADGVVRVELYQTEQTCESIDREASFRLLGTPLVAASGGVFNGRVGNRDSSFVVVARDAQCRVVAFGCAPAEVGRDVEILLSAVTPTDCVGDDCLLCQNDSGMDGGTDRGLDARVDMPGDAGLDAADMGDDAGMFCTEASFRSTTDADGDGIPNTVECPSGDPLHCVNTDETGMPDWCDEDSDDDGIPDSVECTNGLDCQNTDGEVTGDDLPDYRDTDSDNDTLPDIVECTRRPCENSDAPHDDIPDYLDEDSDDDGVDDRGECVAPPTVGGGCALVGDVCPGTADCCDTDCDGLPNWTDIDSDDDGAEDGEECPASGFLSMCRYALRVNETYCGGTETSGLTINPHCGFCHI